MKKVFAVFILTTFLAGGLFAQITFSGSAYVGVRLRSEYNQDLEIDAYHREDWNRVPRLDLTATAMRQNFGARLSTIFQMDNSLDGSVTIDGIYGWVNFRGFMDNDSFRLTMGQISTAVWVTRLHSSLQEYHFDDIRGFRLEYQTPVPGLSVGAAFRTDRHAIREFGREIIFGATFVQPMFSTVIAYDMSSNAHALFGFNFTGIPDLTAGIQLRANRLASWTSEYFFGALEMHQMVGYRIMRPLFAYIIFGQMISGQADSDVGLEFTPGVEFRILPNLTVALSLTIASPDGFETTNLTLNPVIEYALMGPAVLYMEYELHFTDMGRPRHTFGFGIEIRAF